MFDIICYGTVSFDRIMRIQKYPSPGSYVWIEDERDVAGGEAGNSTKALSRWGFKVFLAGTVLGRDDHAQFLVDYYTSLDGVDCCNLTSRATADTPYCYILCTPDGERTMISRHFDKMQGQPLSELPNAKVFTTEPYCKAGSLQAATIAKEMGMIVLTMDTVTHPELAQLSDYIVTSYQELDCHQDIAEVQSKGVEAALRLGRTLIITAGRFGSVAFSPDGEIIHQQPAIVPPKIVDATGCGDVFRAGIAAGLSLGWGLPDCIQFATAASSYNLMAMGGGEGIADFETVKQAAKAGVIDG